MTRQPALLSVETQPLRDPSRGRAKLSPNPITCRCGAQGFGFGVLTRRAFTTFEECEWLCLDCTIVKAREHGYPEGFEWVREIS